MIFRRIASAALLVAAIGVCGSAVRAQSGSSDTRSPAEIMKSFKFHHGHIDLHDGVAALDLPAGYTYLGPVDAETFLTKIYGNPPSSNGPDTDGLILPDGVDPQSADGWAVVLTYDDAGHVSDDDAASMNFEELLKTMQKQTSDANPDRQKQGYPTVELRGWAEPPHYDAAAKTLYWAEQLHFGTEQSDTLNYKIRILGRQGVLELNVIDYLDHLDRIKKMTPALLSMASFKSGSGYGEFNASTDRLAEYGLAGLIAGGVLLKAGFFKALLIGMAALWKPIAAGVVILVGGIARFFRRGPRIKPGA